VLLACFALAGYAATKWVAEPLWWWVLVWFAAAVIGHDLVLFPLYALADRSLNMTLGASRRHRLVPPLVDPVNYIRIPVLGAGLTFLVFLPGIVRQGQDTYVAATGQTQEPFLQRWLLLVAGMFALATFVYVLALRRKGAPHRQAAHALRAQWTRGERVLGLGYQGEAPAVVASGLALYGWTGERWFRRGWEQLAEVTQSADGGLSTVDTSGVRTRIPLTDAENVLVAAGNSSQPR
jgi:hypothetical protein